MKIKEMLEQVQKPKLREKLLRLYEDIENDLKYLPASIKWHQNWKGGLLDHTEQVMNLSLELYNLVYPYFVERGIKRSDVILVSFIHDFDKLDRYVKNKSLEAGRREPLFLYSQNRKAVNDTANVVNKLIPYGIQLSNEQLNAITFHHGGWSIDKGEVGALGTILHCADLISTNVLRNKREFLK